MFGTLLFLSLCVGFVVLGEVYGSFFYEIAPESTASLVLVTASFLMLLFTSPLVFGYLAFCIRLLQGEDAKVAELFMPYGSFRSLCRAFGGGFHVFFAFLLKVALPCAALTYLWGQLPALSETLKLSASDAVLLRALFFLPAAAIVLFGIFALGKNVCDLLCFCACPDETLAACMKTAKERLRGRRGAFFALRLSFLPLIAVSLFTFGILFIAYTLPMLAIAYTLWLFPERMERYGAPQPTAVFPTVPQSSVTAVQSPTYFPDVPPQ